MIADQAGQVRRDVHGDIHRAILERGHADGIVGDGLPSGAHLLDPDLARSDRSLSFICCTRRSPDPFVTTALQTDIARWATNLTVKVVRGGHWMPRNDPGLVADLVRQHTREVAGLEA